jgi:F-type H+-transporting ATPase subunit b
MQNKTWMKRLLLLLLVAMLALVPVVSVMAQDDGGEEGQTTEQVEETGETAEGEEASGDEEGGLLTPLGINPGLLVTQVLNFVLIAVLLGQFLWTPAMNMLDERSTEIQKGLEDAAAAAKARQNAEDEAEKILQQARTEKQQVLTEARQQGEQVKNQMEKEAQQEAERIREEAREDAQAEKEAELAELRDKVIQIATAVAGRIVEEKLDEDKQRDLVSNFFTKLPDGAKSLTGEVTVISAMPLTDAEKQQVEETIDADGYTYDVDPDILGGLVVRSQDRVIDGSTRGNLSSLTSRLK